MAALFLMTGGLVGSAEATARSEYALLISPKSPVAGGTLRVLAAGESGLRKARFRVTGPSGSVEAESLRAGGGPPFWWSAEVPIGVEGAYSVSLYDGREELLRQGVEVSSGQRPSGSRPASVWEIERDWDRGAENLYAAWIDALFRDADERSSWTALHEVTRDPGRNLLHDHLGLGEDDPDGKAPVVMDPDCADNPFYLRAYFAWKLGLPFGFHECDRGTLERAPRTGRWVTNASAPGNANPVRAFNGFLRNIMNTIHSGSARTRLEDDTSDYYPVSLARKDLRPGVVFADPYGHTLILVRWVAQEGSGPGALLAVDAQPDGTVGIKRFWRGNFLFTTSEVIGEPGFKAFRPVVRDRGRLRLLGNAEIAASPDYGNLSLAQKGMASAAFYDTMERLINPKPLDPESALRDLFKALLEQLIVRVESVANGEDYMRGHPGAVVPMPGSAAARVPGRRALGGLFDAQQGHARPHRHGYRPRISRIRWSARPISTGCRSGRPPEEVRKDLEGPVGKARPRVVHRLRPVGRAGTEADPRRRPRAGGTPSKWATIPTIASRSDGEPLLEAPSSRPAVGAPRLCSRKGCGPAPLVPEAPPPADLRRLYQLGELGLVGREVPDPEHDVAVPGFQAAPVLVPGHPVEEAPLVRFPVLE